MEAKVNLRAVYAISDDVVVREIEGDLIIVPIVSGIGDMEEELFSVSESGRTILGRLDGQRTLDKVIEELSEEFKAPPGEIEKDVVGFLEELLKRGIAVEA